MHLLPHGEQRDSHAGDDEKYRGDEPEPVGDRVGDNRGADEGDDHLDGHGAAGFPSWDECGGLTAGGSGEGRSRSGPRPRASRVGTTADRAWAGHSVLTLPSAPLGMPDSRA